LVEIGGGEEEEEEKEESKKKERRKEEEEASKKSVLQALGSSSSGRVNGYLSSCQRTRPLQGSVPDWERMLQGRALPSFIVASDDSPTCCKQVLRVRAVPQMAASSDYPRQRPRRSLIPTTKGSTPRGFAPRPPVGTSTQKKSQEKEKEGATISRSNEHMNPDAKKVEASSISPIRKSSGTLEDIEENDEHAEGISSIRSDSDEEEADIDGKKDETISWTEQMIDEKPATIDSHEEATELGADTDGTHKEQIASKSGFSSSLDKVETGKTQAVKETAVDVDDLSDKMTLEENQSILIEGDEHITEAGDDLNFFDGIHAKERLDAEELLVEETEIDPQAQREMLKELAEENLSRGEKVFVFPQVVMGNRVVQVFLNRSMSTLMNEPDVFIKGAFNEWKWKSFMEKLQKSDLNGDWWSCEIHVPKEAYMMDFVFFNGVLIYENNDYKDFHIAVESGMDAHAFEDFLVEEKRRELERLAQEQAERERQAEEKRRKEEEEAGRKADKALAKIEVEKRRQALQHVIKQAVTSVDNLWHIEPGAFKGEDKVRLFYNRSSRPLLHATEIWIHGGYNNWNDGPSIAEKLSRTEREGGDWWYADGMCICEVVFSLTHTLICIFMLTNAL
ncbi:hypothetical protein Taro_052995, partial [Colocasia esculenta]|nr:hypothetical protein [Colocasia esculenta]